MAPKKQPSGHANRKMKQRREEFIQSQVGSLVKFVTSSKKPKASSLVNEEQPRDEGLVNEEQEGNEGLVNEEQPHDEGLVNEEQLTEEGLMNEEQPTEEDLVNENDQNEVGNEECGPSFSSNIDDPSAWEGVDQNLVDTLVRRGPVRKNDDNFLIDDQNRRFTFAHYTRHLPNGEKQDRKWLVYSYTSHRVYCFCCKLFKQEGNMTQLASEGFKDWKNISHRLKSHESSQEHYVCMGKWIELSLRLGKNETIDKSMQEQIQKEKKHWREVLTRILAVGRTLATHNLPFRGDSERIFVEKNGVFLGIVQMIGTFDLVLQEHFRRFKMSEISKHYLSHKIQNELILMMAKEVESQIVETIKEAKYFSIILDSTPDVSREEQMSLVIRCLDLSTSPIQVKEFFLKFLQVDDTSGQGLFNVFIEDLRTLKLAIGDIRGQCYDNGSNMKGKHKGVQKLMRDINPRAFYTPCGCHSLNLALCDMANSCFQANFFFGVVQRIYVLFSSSTKQWKVFKDKVDGLTVKPLSQTRWESHVESVKAIRYQAPQIRDALLDLAATCDDAKLSSEALSLARNDFEDFEFLVAMIIWHNVLFAINTVSKTLQAENMNIDVAIQ